MHPRSVLISALVHASVLAAAVIVPLLAADVLPAVHSPLAPFVRAFRPADIPLPPPSVAAVPPGRSAGPPTVAPRGIAPEKPAPPPVPTGPTVPFGLEGLTSTGVPAGFGSGDSFAPPPPPPPPPVPVPRVQAPHRVGERIKAPTRVAYAAPAYPANAQASRIEGNVMLEAIIDVDGSVRDVRIVRSVPLLDRAALEAVSRWRYTPALLNGVPVPVIMTVTVSFRLR